MDPKALNSDLTKVTLGPNEIKPTSQFDQTPGKKNVLVSKRPSGPGVSSDDSDTLMNP